MLSSTDAELDQVINEIEGFCDATPVPGPEDVYAFDRLAKAIANFEDKAYPASANR